MAAEIPEKKKSKFTFPTAYTILALLLVVVALLTFVIPAGKYDTNPTDGAPIPGTYHAVEPSPQRLRDAILAPINGMYGVEDRKGNVNVYNVGALYGAIDVALFILMIGGFLGVTMKTGAIDAGIAWVVKRLGAKGKLLIPILMIIFAAGGTSYGMAEESLAFYPLIIAALIALGYDALDGRGGDHAGRGDRRARLDDQSVRHRHRVGLCGHHHRRWADLAHRHSGRSARRWASGT